MWVVDLLLFLMLSICAFTDLKDRRISLVILGMFLMIGLAVNCIFVINTAESIIGGITVGLFFIVISLISKGKIGLGDGLIISICGVYLGFWSNLILVFDTFLFCGLTGAVLMAVKKINLNYELPLIPFMVAAYVGRLFL